MTLPNLEQKYRLQLSKALRHLEYSFKKVTQMPVRLEDNDEEALETWESFCARFSRVVDIFLTKWIKLKVKSSDPAFDGSLRDYLNQAEKMKLISGVDRWLATRELRNIQAHDYTDDELEKFLLTLKLESDFIIGELKDFNIETQLPGKK